MPHLYGMALHRGCQKSAPQQSLRGLEITSFSVLPPPTGPNSKTLHPFRKQTQHLEQPSLPKSGTYSPAHNSNTISGSDDDETGEKKNIRAVAVHRNHGKTLLPHVLDSPSILLAAPLTFLCTLVINIKKTRPRWDAFFSPFCICGRQNCQIFSNLLTWDQGSCTLVMCCCCVFKYNGNLRDVNRTIFYMSYKGV